MDVGVLVDVFGQPFEEFCCSKSGFRNACFGVSLACLSFDGIFGLVDDN